MWGNHVDASLREAIRDASDDRDAQVKAQMVMLTLMRDPEEEQKQEAEGTVVKGKFRDPADLLKQA